MPADIVAEGFDAGIRLGEQIDRDMIAMRVMGEARFLVVASPDYVARHPKPKTPRDFAIIIAFAIVCRTAQFWMGF